MSASRMPDQVETNVAVLTSVFQIRGRLPVLGQFMTFLNDEQKVTFSIMGANVLGVASGNPAAQMTQPEMFVFKRAIQVMLLETDTIPPNTVLFPRTEPMVLYTDQYAIMGQAHMSPDARLADFIDASIAQFIAISQAKVYPLFQARPGLAQSTVLAMVHKGMIRSFHRS